ncbi:DUF1330 domain-containing protein [Bradyrhizobium japonicum]|uniref:Uncharacterized protein n=1 Tax=Bradyrhizobium japonicum TaxID=375 RepID=A0A0A3Y838_BRAJP|nr:DUF1330 domain-containing protein [Bradyrhizobium japonicum]KGT81724.1 hypothetical protein MA20_03105 [Bradyrhizobium japonicum]MCS3497727.1 uncharacterized protein (DUF1330 family) [Bradyrhizobium japonicum]MCS3960112.1 uncharacterized protein (DUF1330 family) [Bradyrhizobium japonicum]MCS4001865.1 uncharacterized protein (DUF1330 family) [Bradyrhizobium japonicum]MCW2221011.1 uncharacterized protein (DUF1330 family) [Bradyrhizobium japonicum]
MLTLIENALEKFLNEDDGQAIVMLNLLRFREDGGKERYTDYLAVAAPIVARFGAEIVYVGNGLPALSAEPGQAWDAVALVRYPNRRAFAELAMDADYRNRAAPMREAALAEAVLQPLQTASS